MEFKQEPNRLFACLVVAAATSLPACGEDARIVRESQGDSPVTGEPGEDASKPSKASDASVRAKDASAEAKADASAATQSDDGRDAGSAHKPDNSTGGGNSSNPLYTGAPACGAVGVQRLAGTIDGKTVAYDLPGNSRSSEHRYEARGYEGEDVGEVELSWEPDLSPGTPSTITEGTLELPATYGGTRYCVSGGTVLADSTAPKDDKRLFFTITKVKVAVDFECTDEEIKVELNACFWR